MIIKLGNEGDYESVLCIMKQVHNKHVNHRSDIFENIDIPKENI